MDQEQVILHQIPAEARLGQVAAREVQNEFMPRIGPPSVASGRNQTRNSGSPVMHARAQPSSRLRVPRAACTIKPVELLGDDDLAAEARSRGQAEGEIEHVLLVLARLLQQLVPFRIDDHVTGRAGERALAGALDVDVVPVRDFEHREAERRIDLAAGPVALDKDHLRHQRNPPRSPPAAARDPRPAPQPPVPAPRRPAIRRARPRATRPTRPLAPPARRRSTASGCRFDGAASTACVTGVPARVRRAAAPLRTGSAKPRAGR